MQFAVMLSGLIAPDDLLPVKNWRFQRLGKLGGPGGYCSAKCCDAHMHPKITLRTPVRKWLRLLVHWRVLFHVLC